MNKTQKSRLVAEIISEEPLKRNSLYGLYVKLLLEDSDNNKFKTINSYMDKMNKK